jgi:SAM-dependent methyltransferase
MRGYGAATYGDRIAAHYDRIVRGGSDPEAAADRLAALCGGAGPALELAIGTGRVALPLAQRGVEVHGIDASEAMVAELRKKPGGDAVPVTIGDFAEVGVEGSYALVFVVFNTFFALLSAEDQQRCFRNVAARVEPGGRFLIEAFVPDLGRFDRGQRVSVIGITLDEVKLDVSIHDPVTQRVDSQHVLISEEGVRLFPVAVRYAWPAELDAMAAAAGLEREHRWAGWCEEPFTASSGNHVSVWRRPA